MATIVELATIVEAKALITGANTPLMVELAGIVDANRVLITSAALMFDVPSIVSLSVVALASAALMLAAALIVLLS